MKIVFDVWANSRSAMPVSEEMLAAVAATNVVDMNDPWAIARFIAAHLGQEIGNSGVVPPTPMQLADLHRISFELDNVNMDGPHPDPGDWWPVDTYGDFVPRTRYFPSHPTQTRHSDETWSGNE